MNNVKKSGRLFTSSGDAYFVVRPETGVPNSAVSIAGIAIAPDGSAYCVLNGNAASDVSIGAQRLTSDGACYATTQAPQPSDAFVSGARFTSDGALRVTQRAADPSDVFVNGARHSNDGIACTLIQASAFFFDYGSADSIAGPPIVITRAAATATYINSAGQITVAAANTPRIDYDPATLACKGLLIEQALTNVISCSDDLTNATYWYHPNVTVAYDGTNIFGLQAAKVTNTTLGNPNLESINGPLASAALYTVRTALLAGSVSDVLVQLYQDSFGEVAQLGTIISGPGTVTNVAGGATFHGLSTSVPTIVAVTTSAPLAAGYQSNCYFKSMNQAIGDSFYVGNVTLGIATFPTSDIIVPGAGPVTRNADVSLLSDISGFWNANAGTAVVKFHFLPGSSNAAAQQTVLSYDDGTANNSIVIARNSSGNCVCVVTTGGVTQSTLNLGAVADNADATVAFAWAPNDFSASLNGGACVVASSGTLPTVTQKHDGCDYAGANLLNGWLERDAYYGVRVANTYVQNLSST